MIELDGSQGEGGGQILRTALTLSMITGSPFRIERIRAKRSKPGLLRQHLTAVSAAAEICGAQVSGAEAGSQVLSFTPGRIRGGDYRHAIGTAGSCTLVLQTVLPALWFADAPSTVVVTGGTHNSAAPPADFLMRSWLPLMRRMGVVTDIELLRHGFYPAGGGELKAVVTPVAKLSPLELCARGEWVSSKATAVIAGIPGSVAQRELERLSAQFGVIDQSVRGLPSNEGPGNALMVELCYEHVTEVFTSFGEKGVASEVVADRVAQEARRYRDGAAVAGTHLADQLLLPMALAGRGSFTTDEPSVHLHTNAEVIRKFLPVDVTVVADRGASDQLHRVTIAS
ncbi:MAG TPA: RNA 3'-terminal phosphate cyclase [Rhodocyclaceae bacterium]|nr:RNA 3'-terminal phosphate cyclase [Rhodocyclaceae bacterium]